MASSSPRSIRSQSGSTLETRAHSHRTVPACQRAQAGPICRRWEKRPPVPASAIFRAQEHGAMARLEGSEAMGVAAEACGEGLRANGGGPRRAVRLFTADALCDRMERGEEEALDRRGVASQRSHFCRREGGPLPTSGRQERKWGHSPIPRFAGKWGQTSTVRSDTSRRQMRSDPIC